MLPTGTDPQPPSGWSWGFAPCAGGLYKRHSLRCPNVVFSLSTRPLQGVGVCSIHNRPCP
jgi:hypothetical protein